MIPEELKETCKIFFGSVLFSIVLFFIGGVALYAVKHFCVDAEPVNEKLILP